MKNQTDYLNRTKDIENIVNIINVASIKKDRLSIAINGKWGSGKSFFLGSLESKLSDKYFVFKYDSWDNDYYNDPLIGILDVVREQLNDINKFDKTLATACKKIIKRIINAFGDFLDSVADTKIGIKPIKTIRGLKQFWKECTEESTISGDFNPYDKVKVAKQLLIASMNQLANIKPVVFIVDEIDRCIPYYALKIIERIHHISENISGCITFFAVDAEQLRTILKYVYSNQDDASSGYLRKIIDFTYELGNGMLDKDFYSNELIDYRGRFDNPISWIDENELGSFIHQLFLGLEMRTTLKIIKNAKYAHDITFGEVKFGAEFMCAELMFAWAVSRYKENIDGLNSDLIKRKTSINFINYITASHNGYEYTFFDHHFNRHYVIIYDLKSLIGYYALSKDKYFPYPLRQIYSTPNYFDSLFNDYLPNLLRIKC